MTRTQAQALLYVFLIGVSMIIMNVARFFHLPEWVELSGAFLWLFCVLSQIDLGVGLFFEYMQDKRLDRRVRLEDELRSIE